MELPCVYDLAAVPEGVVLGATSLPEGDEVRFEPGPGRYGWSLPTHPPAIGERVHVRCNNLGPGKVVSYFHEHGWLGVTVKLDSPPDWHRKQTADSKRPGCCMVFGCEIGAPR